MENYTIVISDKGQSKRITKLVTLNDGSFFLDCPYHSAEKGYLMKHKVNYSRSVGIIARNELIQEFNASHSAKLTVHTSGLVHFSGPGIRSGLEKGVIKGIGYVTSRLDKNPVKTGPTAGITVWGLEDFADPSPKKLKKGSFTMEFSDLDVYYRLPPSRCNAYSFEVFAIDKVMQGAVVQDSNGYEYIDISYAFEKVLTPLRLRVIRLPNIGTFLGVCVSRIGVEFGSNSGYTIHGPGGGRPGNMESIFACYPPIFDDDLPSIDYQPDQLDKGGESHGT